MYSKISKDCNFVIVFFLLSQANVADIKCRKSGYQRIESTLIVLTFTRVVFINIYITW